MLMTNAPTAKITVSNSILVRWLTVKSRVSRSTWPVTIDRPGFGSQGHA